MGHQRLGRLPKTRNWLAVIELVARGGRAEEAAAATARAAESSLKAASNDPMLRHAFWLLVQIPLAAREPRFEDALRRLGLSIDDRPTLMDICSALSAELERLGRRQARTDLSRMASLAAVEALASVVAREGESLFGETYAASETRAALKRLANPKPFSLLARDFFARLTRRIVSYFLERLLPEVVVDHKRFLGLKDLNAFGDAVDAHCRETSFIVQKFAADWHSKHTHEGGIDLECAGGFAYVALGKVQSELKVRHSVAA